VERVRIETRRIPPDPAGAAQIVRDPRACRAVLEPLTAEVDAGRFDTGAHAPALRAAQRLLFSLRRSRNDAPSRRCGRFECGSTESFAGQTHSRAIHEAPQSRRRTAK